MTTSFRHSTKIKICINVFFKGLYFSFYIFLIVDWLAIKFSISTVTVTESTPDFFVFF